MLDKIYPGLVRDFDIEIEHASVAILNALKSRGIRFIGGDEERVPKVIPPLTTSCVIESLAYILGTGGELSGS